jgi:hypothetical protein
MEDAPLSVPVETIRDVNVWGKSPAEGFSLRAR